MWNRSGGSNPFHDEPDDGSIDDEIPEGDEGEAMTLDDEIDLTAEQIASSPFQMPSGNTIFSGLNDGVGGGISPFQVPEGYEGDEDDDT